MNDLLTQENVLCILTFEANVNYQVGAEDGGRGDEKTREESQAAVLPPDRSDTTAGTLQAADTLQERHYRPRPAVLPLHTRIR